MKLSCVTSVYPRLSVAPVFFFSSRRRHTRCYRDWSSDVCSSDLRQQHANEHAYWMKVLTADQVDVNALNAAADQRAQDMAATAKEIIIPALVKVHDALTPAQRQKLASMVKSHHQPQGGFGGPQQ